MPMCRGAATLGGAGCAHVSAHGAIEGSVWGDFGASDLLHVLFIEKDNDSSISHHIVNMVYYCLFRKMTGVACLL